MTNISTSSSASLATPALRGLAILGIFLHNFCHWLAGIVRENEFTFNQENVDGMLAQLAHPTAQLPLHLISFFGHYGVPIFVFLSADGLEKKYGRQEHLPAVLPFLWKHYLKLLVMLLVGYVPYLLMVLRSAGWEALSWPGILTQLTMTNVLLGKWLAVSPDPGPYWYFGLTLQLYVLYRLIPHRINKPIFVALALLCQLLMVLLPSEIIYFRSNAFGNLLPLSSVSSMRAMSRS